MRHMKTTGLNITEAVRMAIKTGCRIQYKRNLPVIVDSDGFVRYAGDPAAPFILHSDFILYSNWEIVHDPSKTMSFQDTLKALRDGKKVKRLAFATCPYRCKIKYVWLHGKDFQQTYTDNIIGIFTFANDDFDADDWFVVEDK